MDSDWHFAELRCNMRSVCSVLDVCVFLDSWKMAMTIAMTNKSDFSWRAKSLTETPLPNLTTSNYCGTKCAYMCMLEYYSVRIFLPEGKGVFVLQERQILLMHPSQWGGMQSSLRCLQSKESWRGTAPKIVSTCPARHISKVLWDWHMSHGAVPIIASNPCAGVSRLSR